MPNPLKSDPSRTTMLRKKYIADMQRRFSAVSRAIEELVVKDDAFGLITSKPLTFMQQVPNQAWRFASDANKVKSYRKWLQQQIDAKILTVDAVSGKPWTATYAESAYQKGMMRAYTQINSSELAVSPDFYAGSKKQFLLDAFAQPASLAKVELMYTRAFDELKGVTEAMGQQMSRILASGLIKGDGPRVIARELEKNVSTMTRTRAMAIARTEVIYAHAEGQLDSFERLGVEEVGVMAEWSTAGDDRVCEECAGYSGEVFTVDEARGMVPLHPNCRCIWIPYVKGVHEKKELRQIEKSSEIKESNIEYAHELFEVSHTNWKEEFREAIENNKITSKYLAPKVWNKEQKSYYLKTRDAHFDRLNAKIGKYKIPQNWERTLTEADKEALEFYQMAFQNVDAIRYLQSGVESLRPLGSYVLDAARGHLPKLEALLKRAPDFNGTIYRGMRLTNIDISKLKKGSEIIYKSIASSSGSKLQAEHFVKTFVKDEFNSGKLDVIFEIKAKTSVRLGKGSMTDLGLDEIIIRKDTSYKILSIEKRVSEQLGEFTHIVLKEI